MELIAFALTLALAFAAVVRFTGSRRAQGFGVALVCVAAAGAGYWWLELLPHAAREEAKLAERPIEVRDARYRLPAAPGFGLEMKADSIADHTYPHGEVWRTRS